MASPDIHLPYRRGFLKRAGFLIAIALLSAPTIARAAAHFVIIGNFVNSSNDPANLDVAEGPGATAVRYTVYQASGNRIEIVFSNNQFATSGDLFNLGGSPVVLPALVEAETVDGAGVPDNNPSSATLRQKELLLSPPQTARGALGMSFLFPVGATANGAHMLVGNPGGAAVGGNYSVSGAAQVAIAVESGEVKDIALTTSPAIVVLNVNGPVVVELVIVGGGKDVATTLIPPSA